MIGGLEEVRKAWEAGEVTAAEIARRSNRRTQTVSRALRGKIDPPNSVTMAYVEALKAIRAERASTPVPVVSADDDDLRRGMEGSHAVS